MRRARSSRSSTIIGWIFIAVGAGGIAAALWPWLAPSSGAGARLPSQELVDSGWVGGSGIAALVGGAFLLRGARWARWLLGAWMAFHVVLSFFHSWTEVLVHGVLFTAIGYFLFRPTRASAYDSEGYSGN